MEVEGFNFGEYLASTSPVYLGDVAASEVILWSDTLVVVTMPPLPHGQHQLKIMVEDAGYARSLFTTCLNIFPTCSCYTYCPGNASFLAVFIISDGRI